MDEIEVPQYFICPISLQIMKDPVTTTTGITYDRDSIEHWLFTNKNTSCPITRQPFPKDSDLIPNHTLLRLIQAWCTQNGIRRFPTPGPSLNKFQVLKLLKDLKGPNLQLKTIKELKLIASRNARNNKCLLLQAGVPKAMILFILTCFRKGQFDKGLKEALSLLQLVDVPEEEIKPLLAENDQILDSLTWVLGCELENSIVVKSHALMLLNTFMQKASSRVMERLKPEMLERIVKTLRCGTSQQGLKAALHVMLRACHWGRNRIMMVESGAVFELIEIETVTPERRTTELIMEILFHLCFCAEGRAQFLSHKGAVALLTDRIFTVSNAVDDRVVGILSLMLSSLSARRVELQEMMEFGTVSKLRWVVESDDHGTYRKEKAREMLKSHADIWKHSPYVSDHDRSFYAKVK